MKHLPTLFCGAVFFATASVSFSPAYGAASIGLNFVGGNNNGTDTLIPTLSAGVVPQTNWNNLTGSNTNSTADGVTVVDSTGAATGVTALWTNGAGNYDNSSTSGTAPLSTNGDQILLNGGIWGATPRGGGPSVTVSNVPYSSYEVIVTSLLDHGGTIISTTLVGGSTVYANQTQNPADAGYIDGTSSSFTYTQATDTTGTGTGLADYALFSGLSGTSFTVSEDIVSGAATAANLSSIEIVNLTIPEPASLFLLGVAVLGFSSRRRAV